MPQRFRVRFGEAAHGWMPVELAAGMEQLAFEASYIPYDSLFELVRALTVLLSADGRTVARWNTEPMEYDFTFLGIRDEARLEILEYADGRRCVDAGTAAFTVNGSRISIVLPFWRALRDIESRSTFEQQWGHAFPTREMRILEERLYT